MRCALLAIADSTASDWTPLTLGQTAALNQFATSYRQHLGDEDGVACPAAKAILPADAVRATSAGMTRRRGVKPPPA